MASAHTQTPPDGAATHALADMPDLSDPVVLGNELVSAKAFADGARIHRALDHLRAQGRPVWVTPDHFRPFWAVGKHAHIMQASMDQHSWINRRRLTLMSRAQEAAAFKGAERYGAVLRTLIHMDEPDHKHYRAVTQGWFNGSAVRAQQAMLDALADEYLAKLHGTLNSVAGGGPSGAGAAAGAPGAPGAPSERSGVIDFASEVATQYPLRVIMAILGVPLEDLDLMHRLTKTLAAPQDPDFGSDVEVGASLFDSIPLFTEYFLKLMEDRRRQPRDDLASLIANGRVGVPQGSAGPNSGAPMGELETVSYYITMAVAGHDTTAAAMAGGCLALAERPEQWAKLKAHPAMLRTAVDEMIRWVTPIKHFMRTATRDTALGDQPIRAGESITMYYLSGNRDEDVFDAPFEFRVDRTPNRHLAFGFGAHVCLGMALSRLELTTLFGGLLRRVESMEPAGPARPVETNFLGGYKSVPIRYRLAQRDCLV